MNEENNRKHRKLIGDAPLCKSKFNNINWSVSDHNHLNGEYKGVVCSSYNFKMS